MKTMKITLNAFLVLCIASLLFSCETKEPPVSYGATPSEHQVKWQQLEYYMFIHFGPNTFTNVEWGDGKEDPKVFNPTDLDCRQWAETAKAAGMKGIIITAKHHDGFCLWPSKYSTHTVRESPWKDGKGDVLKELSEACKEYGLKFGVYLSPWDQNHPAYGTPEYNQIFANTLDEVLSGYGEVFEQWFDGANGGHGKKQVYDWELFHKAVYKNQPQAIIFSDVGPGCRWMGNERGVAGETNWSTMNIEGFEPGHGAPPTEVLNNGEEGGKAWVPAETDVSIRPGWFYSPSTDEKVKSVEKLVDIYYTSVGRNSNLLLNVPPDRRGRIHPNDSIRLMEFRDAITRDFQKDLTNDSNIHVSDARGGSYQAANMLDNDYETYWSATDGNLTPFIEIDFKEKKQFNRLLLQEYIPLGQRVSSFIIKYWDDNKDDWNELVEATTIGYKRILRFPSVNTSKIKIEFNALACPVISKAGIFMAQEFLALPIIERNKEGMVSIRCTSSDPSIYYSTNGEDPVLSLSNRYKEPFTLPDGGTVKAMTTINNGAVRSEIVTKVYDISPEKWTITSPASAELSKIIDDKSNTYIEIDINEPLIIDMGQIHTLKGFSYTPVANVEAANISKYDLYISNSGQNWEKIKSNSIFNNIKNSPVRQDIMFSASIKARYIQISPTELTTKKDKYVVAEFGVITR